MLMQIFLHTIKYVCKINGIIPHTQIIQLYFTQILLNSTLVNIDCNHIAHFNALFLLSLHPKKFKTYQSRIHEKQGKCTFLKKSCQNIWRFQEKPIPLHSQFRNTAIANKSGFHVLWLISRSGAVGSSPGS